MINMIRRIETQISGSSNREMLTDITFKGTKTRKAVLIFCHGFKGFKDWGSFPTLSNKFAEHGFVFVKFNFSHNGGTIKQAIDFPDLKAFSENTFSKELYDLGRVIDAIFDKKLPIPKQEINPNEVFLMGHSRGGGIAILKAVSDKRIKKLVALASVSDFDKRFPKGEQLKKWEKEDIAHIQNSRTKQNMPLRYEFYNDFIKNKKLLDIPTLARTISIPSLIIHGTEDKSVSIEEGRNLHRWITNSELVEIKNAGHSFGSSHPWEKENLPYHLNIAFKKMVRFLNSDALCQIPL